MLIKDLPQEAKDELERLMKNPRYNACLRLYPPLGIPRPSHEELFEQWKSLCNEYDIWGELEDISCHMLNIGPDDWDLNELEPLRVILRNHNIIDPECGPD